MDLEVQVAVQFVLSFFAGKFNKDKENNFVRLLKELLMKKFNGHWYPEKPTKGSAYRCISIENQLDAVLIKAAEQCKITVTDLSDCLPKKLDLWIDPAEVSYRIGEHGSVIVIYKEGDDCVNSTSVHLKKVLDQLPTISQPTQKKASIGSSSMPQKSFSSKRNILSGTRLMNLQQQVANNINIAAAQRRLENQLNPKSLMGRNNIQNLAFLQNQALAPTFNPLLMNMDYLQKLQWLASGAYDPLATAQVVQNILIMQELQRFETRRLALQSHYLKLQGMKWSRKGNSHSVKNSQGAQNSSGVQISV